MVNNKAYKATIIYILILIGLVILKVQNVYAAWDVKTIQKDDGKWYLQFYTQAKTATTNTKYRPLGFKAKFSGMETNIYMPSTNSYPVGAETRAEYEVPITGTGNTVMQRFILKNSSQSDFIIKSFSEGNIQLSLDTIMTIVEGDNILGSLDISGVTHGEVYTTKDGIKYARNWAKRSDLDQFYGIPCTIPPQPIPPENLDAPTPVISRDGTEISSSTSYNVGETIDLSGALSEFPKYAENRYYAWAYKLKSALTYTNLSSGKDNFSPVFPALAGGQYDVSLTVKYDMKGRVYDDLAKTKTITLNIVQNARDAYVTATATASPSKIAFSDKDIPVKVTVTGSLNNFKDTSRIDHWLLYCKMDGTTIQQNINLPAGLTAQTTFEFTIPKDKLDNRNDFLQTFSAQATVYFKDSYNKSDDANCYTSVIKVKEMSPPVAIISCRDRVKAGDNVSISGTGSYDVDGEIVAYYWETFGAEGTIYGAYGNVCYPEVGTYTVQLGVEDNDGNGGVTTKQITVLPPTPTASIGVSGRLKTNRVVTIDSSGSSSPIRWPLVPSKTRWTIQPVGNGATNEIYLVNSFDANGAPWGDKYTTSLLDGVTKKQVIFKDKGEYLVTLTVENTKGLKDTTTYNVFIADDLPPVVDYYVYAAQRRYNADGTLSNYRYIMFEQVTSEGKSSVMFGVPVDSYNTDAYSISDFFDTHKVCEKNINSFLSANPQIKRVYSFTPQYAKLIITDRSYSPDGDYLKRRKVWVYYDANNNGLFTDPEDRVTLIQDLQTRAEIENNKVIEYLCPDTVGNYKVEMELAEGWGN